MNREPLHRSAGGLAALWLAIDARRPASWIALVAGAVAGVACGRRAAEPAASLAIAIVAAAAAATAAIGDLPLALLPAPLLRSRRGCRQVAGWAVERAAWAAVGFACAVAWSSAWPWALVLAAAAICSAAAAAVTLCGARLAGATPADAAGLVLVLVAASGAAAAAAPGGTPAAGAAAAAAVWGVLAAGGWLWSRGIVAGDAGDGSLPPPDEHAPDSGAAGIAAGWRDSLAPPGAVGRVLEWTAMGWALVAMAAWLVLDDESVGHGGHAAAWAGFTAAWFVALGLPGMALQEGAAGSEARSLLCRSAVVGRAAAPGGWARVVPTAWLRPGPVRFAASAGLLRAAVLGWPPLVCALVTLPTPARSLPAARIVIGLAAAAALASLVVAAAVRGGVGRETAFAGLLGAVTCAAAWLAAAGHARPAIDGPAVRLPDEPHAASLAGPGRAPSPALRVVDSPDPSHHDSC